MLKAVLWAVAPSPNDQFHVAPVADELTLNVSGTPVVALAETFRIADGVEAPGAGVGVDPEVDAGTATIDFAVSPLTVAATVDVLSLAPVKVVVAVPDEPVATFAGATAPDVALNATTTPLSGAPLAFCTRAVTLMVPVWPVPEAVLTVIAYGIVGSMGVGAGCVGF